MSTIEKSRVEEINRLHSEIAGLFLAALEKAIRIGEVLTEIKAESPHGSFIKWFEQAGFSFKLRSAQEYMTMYQNKDFLVEQGVENIRSARQLLKAAKTHQNAEQGQDKQNHDKEEQTNTHSGAFLEKPATVKLTPSDQELIKIMGRFGIDEEKARDVIIAKKANRKPRPPITKPRLKRLPPIDTTFYKRIETLATERKTSVPELIQEAIESLARSKKKRKGKRS